MRRLLEAPGGPPTAVICSSDIMALGVLREAEARGLRVPRDLSIVGFDGIDAAAWSRPPLTTVEQPIEDIADTAVRALRQLIAESRRSLPNYVFRPHLRLGGSTGPPPVAKRGTRRGRAERKGVA